jgi:hypothetical protein
MLFNMLPNVATQLWDLLKYSMFWVVSQIWLAVIYWHSGQPIGPIIKIQAVQEEYWQQLVRYNEKDSEGGIWLSAKG